MENKITANWPGWEIVRQIGEGTYGSVYEIRKEAPDHVEKAALKVISIPKNRSELDELYGSGLDEKSISDRFRGCIESIVREYALMDELKGNSNIVCCDEIRHIPHEDGIGWDIYIRMELLTPMLRTLGTDIREEEVIKLGMHLCNALVACKSRNIVHRDIKPQNIFVSRDGYYKLGDFGVAKTAENITSGTKAGTHNFMAPEVYRGKPYGAGADICSLGLVMYWMLNRRRGPFLPSSGNYTLEEEEAARNCRFSGEALPRPAGGSARLQEIVLKACAFDPAERYLSAADMLSDLKSLNQDVVSDGIIDGVVSNVIGKEAVKERNTGEASGEKAGSPVFAPVRRDKAQKEKPAPAREQETKTVPAFTPARRPAPSRIDHERTKAGRRGWLVAITLIAVLAIIGGIVGVVVTSDFFGDLFAATDRETGGEDKVDGSETGENAGGDNDEAAELAWSGWATTLPDFVFDGNYIVEVVLQYRSAPLYYYIGSETLTEEFTVCYTGYGDWSSEWSDWQTEPVEANGNTEVETGTRYWYRDGWWEKYNDIQRDTPDNPYTWKWGSAKYTDNVLPEEKSGRERLTSMDQPIYRYRTRPTTYYCVKNSEWSEFGDQPLCPSHDTVVNTRIMYRYAENTGGEKSASLSNFPQTIPAYTSRFADVPNDKWYGAEQGNWVGIAVHIGAMSADEYLRFRPEETITVGELIKAAVVIRKVYNGESAVMENTTPWYGVYVDYAIETGIIEAGVFADYSKAATRAEAAYILGRALPEEEYGKINTVRAITDMDAASIYFKSVWRLAESGVIAWPDPESAYDGAREISRAEVAAMIGRVVYPDKRVSNG